MPMISIVDYNTGNVGAIHNMLQAMGLNSILTSDPKIIEKSSHIILAGVGSFDQGMTNLLKSGLVPLIENQAFKNNIPVLGICLGAQLMCNMSEEGELMGLGWIPAVVKRFPTSINNEKLRVPHIGWSHIAIKEGNKLFHEIAKPKFYFVHSYFIECIDRNHVISECHYGLSFDAGFVNGNIVGVQFHPEKSHNFGISFFKNFLRNHASS